MKDIDWLIPTGDYDEYLKDARINCGIGWAPIISAFLFMLKLIDEHHGKKTKVLEFSSKFGALSISVFNVSDHEVHVLRRISTYTSASLVEASGAFKKHEVKSDYVLGAPKALWLDLEACVTDDGHENNRKTYEKFLLVLGNILRELEMIS